MDGEGCYIAASLSDIHFCSDPEIVMYGNKKQPPTPEDYDTLYYLYEHLNDGSDFKDRRTRPEIGKEYYTPLDTSIYHNKTYYLAFYCRKCKSSSSAFQVTM